MACHVIPPYHVMLYHVISYCATPHTDIDLRTLLARNGIKKSHDIFYKYKCLTNTCSQSTTVYVIVNNSACSLCYVISVIAVSEWGAVCAV